MKKIIICAAVVLLASSCGSVKKTFYSSRADYLPYSLRATPMTTELNVAETKVSGKADNPGNVLTKKMLEEAAVGDALNKAGADILFEPFYEYTVIDGKYSSVTVTGYPATYVKFRPMTIEDAEIVSKLNSPAPETIIVIKESDKK